MTKHALGENIQYRKFPLEISNRLDENGLKAIVCILNNTLSGILGALLHSFSFVFKAMFDGGNNSN